MIIDPDSPPLVEPDVLVVGSTWKWKRDLPNYLPATYTLTYSLVDATNKIDITASDAGDQTHLVNVAAATTAAYVAGDYSWQAYVSDGTDRFDVGTGTVRVKADFSDAAVDGRSHVKKVLDALEALLEGKASQDQLSYSISGRSLSRLSPTEVREWYATYKEFWRQEQAAERINRGLASGNKIKVRF